MKYLTTYLLLLLRLVFKKRQIILYPFQHDESLRFFKYCYLTHSVEVHSGILFLRFNLFERETDRQREYMQGKGQREREK